MSQNNTQYSYQMPPQPPVAPPIVPPVQMPPRKVTKNKFLTFVLALFPGAGQMYHVSYTHLRYIKPGGCCPSFPKTICRMYPGLNLKKMPTDLIRKDARN